MKKFLALLLACVLVLALCACGKAAPLSEEEKLAKVEELYLNKLSGNGGTLEEYRVDKVEPVDNETLSMLTGKDGFFPDATDDAVFAYVTYSVKPAADYYLAWTAGNGEEQGDWIVNKTACVCVDKVNGEFALVSDGTGW